MDEYEPDRSHFTVDSPHPFVCLIVASHQMNGASHRKLLVRWVKLMERIYLLEPAYKQIHGYVYETVTSSRYETLTPFQGTLSTLSWDEEVLGNYKLASFQ